MSALYYAADLATATGGTVSREVSVTGVSIDTRTLRQGDLFVALHSDHGDGHRFVQAAIDAGAAAALVDHVPDDIGDFPLVVVPNTQAALTALGAFARARFAGRVIAVTGSVGKTTTKEMLREILSASGKTHAAQASYNNHWGVPLTLALTPLDADFAVIEIGMNQPGEIAPLAALARPHVALITTIASAHIGNMGSLTAIADEKAAILGGLVLGGVAILPSEQAMLPRLRAGARADVTCIVVGDAGDCVMREDADGSDVRAQIGGAPLNFTINAPGRHMVHNALMALTGVAALGADVVAGAATLARFGAISGRGVQRPILGGAAVLLDESYNANTASVRAALGVLRLLPASRRIAVLGDMLELGEFSTNEHISLANDLRESADLLYACGPAMKFLFDSCPTSMRAFHTADSASLAPIVAGAVRAGDAVLVKGSFGSRMRLVVDALIARGA